MVYLIVNCAISQSNMLFRLFFIVALFPQTLTAQRLVTGKVLDITTKEKIEGVDVTVYKGTSFAKTREHGYFQIHITDGDSLLIAHPNYKLGLIQVPEVDAFTIYLEPVDDYPVYLQGLSSLYNFLQRNIEYPGAARFQRVEGIVAVLLSIDPEGEISECRALNDIGGNCDRNTIEVFKMIPGEWSKGTNTKNLIFPVFFIMDSDPEEVEVPDVEKIVGKVMEAVIVSDNASGY